jgi:hypothetical protein
MQECKTGVLLYNFNREYTDMMTRQRAFYKLISETLKHPECTQ